MKSASITFSDEPDDNVGIRIEFGDGGTDDNSGAHRLAIQALTLLMKSNENVSDLEIDGDDE